jgi:hypothetical protein
MRGGRVHSALNSLIADRLNAWSPTPATLANICARAITVTPWVVRYRWKQNENLRVNLEGSNWSNEAISVQP